MLRGAKVKYIGEPMVRDGQAWNITCTEVPAGVPIMWKRNGLPMVEDLASGIIHVEPSKLVNGMQSSALVATTSLERHEGSYQCAEGNETDLPFHLTIVYGL